MARTPTARMKTLKQHDPMTVLALEPRRLLAGDFSGLITFGQEEEFDTGVAVLTDASGATYVAGTFLGTIDVDPRQDVRRRLRSDDDRNDIFLAKYEGRRLVWSRRFGGSGNDEVSVMRFSPDGDIILAGQFDQEARFGSGKGGVTVRGNGRRDIYFAKISASGGAVRWVKTVGGGRDDRLTALNVGPDGDIYYSGTIRLSGDVDPGPRQRLITTEGSDDTVISRLDGGDGSLKWFKVFGEDDTRETITGLEVDGQGRVVVVGLFNRELRFDRKNAKLDREAVGEDDVYIARLSANGRFEFVRTFGGKEFETVADVAVGPDGSIHLTGNFSDESDFDPSGKQRNLVALSENDAYVAKFRPDGRLVWVEQIGGEDARITAQSIGVAPDGSVYAAGDFNADDSPILIRRAQGKPVVLLTDKDDAPIIPTSVIGQSEGYLVRLNPQGEFTDAVQFGGEDGSVSVRDIAVTEQFVHLTGAFAGEDGTDFDPGTGTVFRRTDDERQEADVFLLRLEA